MSTIHAHTPFYVLSTLCVPFESRVASAFCLLSSVLSKLETARWVLIHEMRQQRVKLQWACDGESLRSP